MKFFITDEFIEFESDLLKIRENFKNEGVLIGSDKRNSVKYFQFNNQYVNFKSFKKPNFFNRIIYRYLRKSKARRSFEYANFLLSKGFLSPKPIGYIKEYDSIGLTSSFYICEHLKDAFTLRDVIQNKSFSNRTTILKEYSALVYQLHENGIEFIDNSSGNFVIVEKNDQFLFYLVDLNRMKFHQKMRLNARLNNFARITGDRETLYLIAEEYAKLANIPTEICFEKIIQYRENYQQRYSLKRKIKDKLKSFFNVNTENKVINPIS